MFLEYSRQGPLVFEPEHEDSVIEDDGRVRQSFRRQKTMIEGAVAHTLTG